LEKLARNLLFVMLYLTAHVTACHADERANRFVVMPFDTRTLIAVTFESIWSQKCAGVLNEDAIAALTGVLEAAHFSRSPKALNAYMWGEVRAVARIGAIGYYFDRSGSILKPDGSVAILTSSQSRKTLIAHLESLRANCT
jgi:hypothetical protein